MYRSAYFILLLTALFWGGNAVAGKIAVGHVSPMLLTALRWGLATLFLLAISRRQLAADWPLIRRNFVFLTCLAALGFTVFNALLYTALAYTSAINVSIEQAGIPMVIFLGNFILFGLKPGAAQMAGFLLSLAGVALTASHGEFARLLELEINLGDGLMLIAVILFAGYTIGLRFKPEMNWQSLVVVLCAAGFLTSVPFVAAEWLAGGMIPPDATGWGAVFFIALFPSAVGQILYIKGVALIGANRAGMFINMVPIFGALLSVLILAEDFHLYHAVAMALVILGIWLSEIGQERGPTGG